MTYPTHRAIITGVTGVILSAGLPQRVAYPNQDGEGITRAQGETILDVQVLSLTRSAGLGDFDTGSGQVVTTVISERGYGASDSADIAQAVANIFPAGLQIALTGGRVVFDQAPTIQSGFGDGAAWRVPVVAPFLVLS